MKIKTSTSAYLIPSLIVAFARVAKLFESVFRGLFLIFISIYQVAGRPWMVAQCRFEPTCSEYAKESLNKHSIFKAIILIVGRLSRCRPGGSFGYDPVPECKRCKHAE